ncbi:MAG: trypsin-like peptidase domain-containing protein, partial [Spirochaetales bacterium]|nr:trypsin-like peptidase domain-containing protein [Spirochaetales bacterium]
EVTREQIEQNILNGNPFAAIQDLDLLKRRGTEIPVSELEELHRDAAQALKTMFQDSLEKKDYNTALSIYRSAESLSITDDYEGWTQSLILSEEAKRLLEKGEAVGAYLTLDRAVRLGEVKEQDARLFFENALEDGYISLAELLKTGAIGSELPDIDGKISTEPGVLLKGTATILVNRGIRMDRGIGYPDSVIGSGFFVDRRGYVLTNYHIIESEVNPEYEGFSRLYVRPHSSESVKLPARVVGWDSVLDVALLKTEIEPEYVFPLDSAITYKPGDVIYAIGSPGGLRNTVTSGIVSAIGRRFLQIGTTLQVDVPVNPGSSGGPLVNADGKLIGVVFAGIEQFEGINFAIPAEWVIHVVPQLFAGGASVHSWLGLTVEETVRGLEVSYVLPGEAAGRAGIIQGDIITAVYGTVVKSVEDVHRVTIDLSPNTLIEVKWKRDGMDFSGFLSLGQRPELPIDAALKKDMLVNLIAPLFGMAVEEAGNFFWDKSYVIRRVYPGGIADETGLSVNDPFTILKFEIDNENRVGYLQIVVKKKKAGFVERAIQLGAYLEIDKFI